MSCSNCQRSCKSINCHQRSCTGCVTGTGRPGTLSNVTTVVNGVVVPNWDTLDQIQKQIQNVVRVQSSEYTMNLAAHNASDPAYYNPQGDVVAPHQQSDRGRAHGQPHQNYAPHSSSTVRSLTRLRPNVSSAPTTVPGVDIKHNSYDRYLNRLKGKGPLCGADRPAALRGAKNTAFSIGTCGNKI
jgi:hypothetical protein